MAAAKDDEPLYNAKVFKFPFSNNGFDAIAHVGKQAKKWTVEPWGTAMPVKCGEQASDQNFNAHTQLAWLNDLRLILSQKSPRHIDIYTKKPPFELEITDVADIPTAPSPVPPTPTLGDNPRGSPKVSNLENALSRVTPVLGVRPRHPGEREDKRKPDDVDNRGEDL